MLFLRPQRRQPVKQAIRLATTRTALIVTWTSSIPPPFDVSLNYTTSITKLLRPKEEHPTKGTRCVLGHNVPRCAPRAPPLRLAPRPPYPAPPPYPPTPHVARMWGDRIHHRCSHAHVFACTDVFLIVRAITRPSSLPPFTTVLGPVVFAFVVHKTVQIEPQCRHQIFGHKAQTQEHRAGCVWMVSGADAGTRMVAAVGAVQRAPK